MIDVSRYTVAVLCLIMLIQTASAAIFSWTDSDGKRHFGDNPPANASASRLKGIKQGNSRRAALVAAVIDGDTLRLTTGERVRLLGINAPEVATRGKPGQTLGDEARSALVSRTLNQPIKLQTGREKHDKYNRLLAHVFDDKGNSINVYMLEKGLAHVSILPPNIAYADEYLRIEQQARDDRVGIWALADYGIFSPDELFSQRNTFKRVRATLLTTHKKRTRVVLQFSGGFSADIHNDDLQGFSSAGVNPDSLIGKQLVIRGWVRQRQGKPYMKLLHSSQIESVR